MEQDILLNRLEDFFAEDASAFIRQTPPFNDMLVRALALILSQGNDPASPAILSRLSSINGQGQMNGMGQKNGMNLINGTHPMNGAGQTRGNNKLDGPDASGTDSPDEAGDGAGDEAGREISAIAADILDSPTFFQGLPKRTIFSASRFLEALAHETLDLEELYSCSEETILETLLALKGIGPDTAEAMVLHVFNKAFIPVNRGLYRIANRHGGIPESPEREEIRDWYRGFFPEDAAHIRQTHSRLLAVARRFCKASTALCTGCPLNDML